MSYAGDHVLGLPQSIRMELLGIGVQISMRMK